MITNISLFTLYVTDQDEAKKFYVDVLGFEERSDIKMGEGFRWVTVGHPSQPELQVTLMTPGPPLERRDGRSDPPLARERFDERVRARDRQLPEAVRRAVGQGRRVRAAAVGAALRRRSAHARQLRQLARARRARASSRPRTSAPTGRRTPSARRIRRRRARRSARRRRSRGSARSTTGDRRRAARRARPRCTSTGCRARRCG